MPLGRLPTGDQLTSRLFANSPSPWDRPRAPATGNQAIANAAAIRRLNSQKTQSPQVANNTQPAQPAQPQEDHTMQGALNGMMMNAVQGFGGAIGGAMGQLGDQLNRNAERASQQQLQEDSVRSINAGKMERLGMVGQIMGNLMGGGGFGGGGSPFFTNFGQFAIPSSAIGAGGAGLGGVSSGNAYNSPQNQAEIATQRQNLFKMLSGLRNLGSNPGYFTGGTQGGGWETSLS